MASEFSASTDCPSENTAQALVDGNVDKETRSHVLSHLGQCQTCHEWVAELAKHTTHESEGSKEVARLGRYELHEVIGAGGMGLVYRAYDPILERHVAVKLIQGDEVGAKERSRLLREARTIASLSHPDVVSIFDAGQEDGELYYAMEILEGPTLRDWYKEHHPNWSELLPIAMVLARALASVHEKKVVHRDFKPDNIIMVGQSPVIVDFGLAYSRSSGEGIGTPRYMAPELMTGQAPDSASDQYALAVTLVECLAGGLPGPALEVLLALDTLPRRIQKILERALSPQPVERWASLEELADALEAASARKYRRLWWGAGVATMLALGIFLWSNYPNDSADTAAVNCTETSRSILQYWPKWRAEIDTALQGHKLALADRQVQSLTTFAESWQGARHALCREKPSESGEGAVLRSSRIACLETIRSDFKRSVNLLRSDDFEFANHGLVAIDKLTPSEYCLRRTSISIPEAPPSGDPELYQELQHVLADASGLFASSRPDEALRLLERARPMADQLAHLSIKGKIFMLEGEALHVLGKPSRSMAALQKALDAFERAGDDVARGETLTMLCGSKGDEKVSAEACLRADALVSRLDIPWLSAVFDDVMGVILLKRGKYDESRQRLEAAQRGFTEIFGPEDGHVLHVLHNLGSLALTEKDYPAAARYLKRTYELSVHVHGEEHIATAIALLQLASLNMDEKEYALGMERMTNALTTVIAQSGDTSDYSLSIRSHICQALLNQQAYPQATVKCQEALDSAKRRYEESDFRLGNYHYRLGQAFGESDALAPARKHLERAVTLVQKDLVTHHWGLARFYLAMVLHAQKKQAKRAWNLASEAKEYLPDSYDEWIDNNWHNVSRRPQKR